MAAQQEVSRALLAEKVGRTIPVLIDEVDAEGAIGRSMWDAPEIDGSVLLNGERGVRPGDIVRVQVTASDEVDLWGEVVLRKSQA
jgi:ribosomal protein S12 methylthiotransferase